MDKLADEVLLLIWLELDDPSALAIASRRFYEYSKDPYVRSKWFLERYGPLEALYWAVGRGKLANERVLEIMLSSGAHLSRYFLQCVIQHYCKTGNTSNFIRGSWARSLGMTAFSHLLRLGAARFGETISVAKNEDDGSLFHMWIAQKRIPGVLQTNGVKPVDWEIIKDMFERCGFIPFCPKDPIFSQFPLALAAEPRLLPLAVANGFSMDAKYRDFVFRKIFERPPVFRQGRDDEIVRNVRELCRLDPSMFLSRTVAAEVSMEIKSNEPGFNALKTLDKDGDLRFPLSELIADLLKLFVHTRSVTSPSVVPVLHALYREFPAPNYPTIRLVILLTLFCVTSEIVPASPEHLHNALEGFDLLPLQRTDLIDILVSPFSESPNSVFAYARAKMGFADSDIRGLAVEVAIQCLEIGSKGKLIKCLFDTFPPLRLLIRTAVLQLAIQLDDIRDVSVDDRYTYKTKLNDEFGFLDKDGRITRGGDEPEDDDGSLTNGDRGAGGTRVATRSTRLSRRELGYISQDTLSFKIRAEENGMRSRRGRFWYYRSVPYPETDYASRLSYPDSAIAVGLWILETYGPRDRVTAIFMTHGIINNNVSVIDQYFEQRVPVTLKHFKLLAKLGRPVPWCLSQYLTSGAEFFFSEEDYLPHDEMDAAIASSEREQKPGRGKKRSRVDSGDEAETSASARASRKRPRRSAALTPVSYVVPGSDDEGIAEDGMEVEEEDIKVVKEECRGKSATLDRKEINLRLWIRHLTTLVKEEERLWRARKKNAEKSKDGTRQRIAKTEFLRCLTLQVRQLRDELNNLTTANGMIMEDIDDLDDGSDGEYQLKTAWSKPRKKRAIADATGERDKDTVST